MRTNTLRDFTRYLGYIKQIYYIYEMILYRGYVGLTVLPRVDSEGKEIVSNLVIEPKLRDQKEEEDIKAGNLMLVYSVGEGVTWANIGDKVFVASHGRLQKVTVEGKNIYVIRESDLLAKV
jgi:co-chaperonin GroES (HSP10)